MAFWSKSPQKPDSVDWHDSVVTVAVLARNAGFGGPLHDMVVSHYSYGRAVPRNDGDWHLRTIRRELKRFSRQGTAELVRAARAALKVCP